MYVDIDEYCVLFYVVNIGYKYLTLLELSDDNCLIGIIYLLN